MAEPWAAKFYNSKPWKGLRARLVAEAGYSCSVCGGNFVLNPSRLIGHHTIELTPGNISDPEISLNPALIKIVCKDCHDREHERFRFGGGHNVYIVYGPPCAGKSTWVNQTAERGDLIVDLDLIFAAISGCVPYDHPEGLNRSAFAVRDLLLDQIYTRLGKWKDAYVVGGYPRKMQREQLAVKLGAELVYIEATREETEARASSRGVLEQEWLGYIAKWFRDYQP